MAASAETPDKNNGGHHQGGGGGPGGAVSSALKRTANSLLSSFAKTTATTTATTTMMTPGKGSGASASSSLSNANANAASQQQQQQQVNASAKTPKQAAGSQPPSVSMSMSSSSSSSLPPALLNPHPDYSECLSVHDSTFGPSTGISDDELRLLLSQRVTCKSWELKKKVEASDDAIKKLKDALLSLQRGKNRLKVVSVDVELLARTNWARCLDLVQLHSRENDKLRVEIKSLSLVAVSARDGSKDAQRDVRHYRERVSALEEEIAPLREALAGAERAHTEVACCLAAAEGRGKEAAAQAQSWRSELSSIEAEKGMAVQMAEKRAADKFDDENKKLRIECAELRTKMQGREEELSRLVGCVEGGGGGGANASGSSSSNHGSTLTGVKLELDRLRQRVSDAETALASRASDLERASSDCDAAHRRASEKEKDFASLMASIGEIQRSGQAREDEARDSRKDAEARLHECERTLAAARTDVQMLAAEKAALLEVLANARSTLATAESDIENLKKELLDYKKGQNGLEMQLRLEKELRSRAEGKELEEKHERIAMSAQMMAMTQDHTASESRTREEQDRERKDFASKIEILEAKLKDGETAIMESNEQIRGLKSERGALKEAMNSQKNAVNAQSAQEISRLTGEVEIMKEKLKNAEFRAAQFGEKSAEDVSQLELQLQKMKAERRKMHNVIQELRGNVRVFARIRPFLPDDNAPKDAASAVALKGEFSLKIAAGKNEHSFDFDKVFAPSVGQETVFTEVSEFVQSALDGYNVCLFSYGQTGSGKTHTMQGSGVGQMRGIIPRAIEQVGTYKQQLEKDGWKYEMKVSFLEIYNETIRDLLREDNSDEVKHEIKVDANGRRYVSELTVLPIEPTDAAQVEEVMRQAAKHRSVASTDMNSVSSRSHSVFTLHLLAVHEEHKQCLRGTLNLVDLAGSERLEKSGATGDRAKEAMAINKSLSSLTDVFSAIGKKAPHVPFRNSKLTYLLQPSLSGDGKTLMMVNLSPTEDSYLESLCSLRFAAQVNKCELGKPKKSIEDTKDGESILSSTPAASAEVADENDSSTANCAPAPAAAAAVASSGLRKMGVKSSATTAAAAKSKAVPNTPTRVISKVAGSARPATAGPSGRSRSSPPGKRERE